MDFRREYLVRLPLPLAQLYGRAYNDKSPQSRHNNTFYLFEALVKLAAAPAIACYAHEVRTGRQPRVAHLDRLLIQLALPSFGQWVGLLRELAKHFGSRPEATSHPLGHLWTQLHEKHRDRPALLALYRRIKNGVDGSPAGDQSCSVLDVLDALVQYRNGVFGHGGPRFDSFYEREMGPLLFPAANELLEEGVFEFLGPRGSRLVYLTEVRTLDEERTEVGLRELVGLEGERMAPLPLTREQADGLVPNRVAVLWPGRTVPLRFDPLLVYRESETAEEVLFLNRDRNARQVEYLSYTTGKTERDPHMAPDLCRLLSLFAGRDIDEHELQQLSEQSAAETPSVESLLAETPRNTLGRVWGDYEILAEIGRGGMGVVYLARQLSLGRLVALKMLPTDLAADPVALARFRREIQHLARCEHPNIVKVLASGTMPDGELFYTMEYVPGCDLEQVWRELGGGKDSGWSSSKLGQSTWAKAVLSASRKRREETVSKAEATTATGRASRTTTSSPQPGAESRASVVAPLPLPPLPELTSAEDDPGGYLRRVCQLVRDAALALQAVHDHKLVHRDVKPANLMLTPDGSRVVLMDFGLAKGESLALTASRSAGFLGTLRYAAPEQLAAATIKVGPPADVRGLGCVLWELLTGRRLFAECQDEKALAVKVLQSDVPRLRTVDSGFDRDLEAIVTRATERRIEDRIPSAGQLAQYLQLYLDHKPLPIRPPSGRELLSRWCRQNALAAAALAAVAGLLIVGSIGGTTLAVIANLARREADTARTTAEEQKGEAERARTLADKNAQTAAAEKFVAERRLAESYLERGLRVCDEGEAGKGALWLARALEALPATGPTTSGALSVTALSLRDRVRDPEHAIRANLNAWRRWISPLKTPLGRNGDVFAVAYNPDGRTVVTASEDDAQVWDAATGEPIGLPLRHDGTVWDLAYSPDGKTILTGSGSLLKSKGEARLWDAATGKPISPPFPHDTVVMQVFYGPNGKTVLTASHDRMAAQLWNTATGQPIGSRIPYQSRTLAAAYSPDGKSVLMGSIENSARLWDTATGQKIGPPLKHQNTVSSVAFSPDGKTVLTGSDKTAQLWDATTLKTVGPPFPHRSAVYFVGYSPDGTKLLTGSYDNTVRLWDAGTGQPSGELLQHEKGVRAVGFMPDGKTALTTSNSDSLRLWDVATCQPIGAPLRQDTLYDVAVSPDGRTILTGGIDDSARLWDRTVGQPIGAPLRHEDAVTAVAYSPDGKIVLTGSNDGTARLWEVVTGQPMGPPLRLPNYVDAVAYSPDGKTVLTGSGWRHLNERHGEAQVWDAATGQPIGPALRHGETVIAVAYSPDSKIVLTGSADTTARLWDAATGQPLGPPLAHQNGVIAVAYDPNGKTVLTGSRDNTARLWDVATCKAIGAPLRHEGIVRAVAYSPDGKTALTGSEDKTARLWDAATGKPLGAPLQHQGIVNSVGYSPDGSIVVTGSMDRTARLWNAATGKPLGAPLQHQEFVTAVAFSPDGKSVLTGSFDHTARLWDTATGQPIGSPFEQPDSVLSVAYSPDGKTFATGSGEKTARIWPVPLPIEGDSKRMTCWIQVITNMELDEGGAVRTLRSSEWFERRRQLESLGGPPITPTPPVAWNR